jgi:hypothetical protein
VSCTQFSWTQPDLLQNPFCPDIAYLRASVLVTELLKLLTSTPHSYGNPPPPYDPSDQPPAYLVTEDLARAHIEVDSSAPLNQISSKDDSIDHNGNGVMDDTIDFGDTTGVQSRGKKQKQAAKKAQQAKWAEDDNEEGGQNAGDGGDGNGGGGGDDGNAGGGAGGSGGDGDNNGDGAGDNDDWFGGGGKKNKKGKKSKKQEEEEKEEEEEQKKKEEEDAGASNTLNWADDANAANGEDDWTASFTTKKDKKKKGKKVSDALYEWLGSIVPTDSWHWRTITSNRAFLYQQLGSERGLLIHNRAWKTQYLLSPIHHRLRSSRTLAWTTAPRSSISASEVNKPKSRRQGVPSAHGARRGILTWPTQPEPLTRRTTSL